MPPAHRSFPVLELDFPVVATESRLFVFDMLSLTYTAGTAGRIPETGHRFEAIEMRLTTTSTLLLTFTAVAATACAQGPEKGPVQPPASAAAISHEAAAQDIKWGPAPAIFPPGAQMAVMQGNPAGTALFTVRLRMPDGYKIPPHTHPTDEHVTVISGTFRVGMGPKFDTNGMLALAAGGFVTAPANGAHFALTQGPTIVQVHAIGPFAMTYVNPDDTPKGASK